MKKVKSFLALIIIGLNSNYIISQPCVGGVSGGYPCQAVSLLSHIPLSTFNASSANDSWGWTDPQNGKEYILMGLDNGTAFIDVTNPSSPQYLGKLPTHSSSSVWRDVKVYNNFAFIVSEANGHGMQVFDLTRLRNVSNPPTTFTEDAHYNEFSSAHNIAINVDSGFAYVLGTSTYGGGPHFVNIQNPINPIGEGGYSNSGYSHDAQIVIYNGPDLDYQGREILISSNGDRIVIVDVTDKNSPVLISEMTYANIGFTKQGWLTGDHEYFIITDEQDEINFGFNSRKIIANFTDLDNPSVSFEYFGPNQSIDFNGYTIDDKYFYASWTSGMRILDVSDLSNGAAVEIGFFDTYPANNNTGFNGAWHVFPFLPSGNIHINDTQGGFFMVQYGDSESPVAVCQNITIQLGINGTATITAQDIDGGSTDNAGIQNFTASQSVFTCDDLGPNNVTLTVEDYFGNTDTCVAMVTVLEALELDAPANLSIAGDTGQCFASNVDLGEPVTLAACTWNLTNDAPQEFPIGQTAVTWTLENGSGQTTTSQQLVEIYMSEVDNAQVCYVTSDWNNPSLNRVFSKYSGSLNGQNVDYHEVFRESSTGAFETVGYIVPPAESFLDAAVNNNIQSYRYKIRTMDICGEQGPLSDYHKTILLQSSIAADNSINLAWNPYLGVSFSTYYIYRSVNGAAFELLGSLAATNTSYNDISANVLENFYEYFVSIDATTCANDPFQNPAVRSNQEYVNPNLVIKENDWLSTAITIYPNPATEYLNISVTDDLELKEVVVYNTLGQRLMVSKQDQIDVSTLPSGVYYLSIETNQGRVNKTLVRE